MLGKLHIVSTPIGNLEDITIRAIDTLKSVDKVYAEDTRVGLRLLKSFDIEKPLNSFHAHSNTLKYDLVLKDLIDGFNLALITDAGTPGISDPGNELVNYLLKLEPNIQVIPVPGASALTTAVSVSGFNMNSFIFLGFLPKKKLNKTLEIIANSEIPVICYDSPHRIKSNLLKLSSILKTKRNVFIGRELTKMHETHYRGDINEVLVQLNNEKNLKGELVLIIDKL